MNNSVGWWVRESFHIQYRKSILQNQKNCLNSHRNCLHQTRYATTVILQLNKTLTPAAYSAVNTALWLRSSICNLTYRHPYKKKTTRHTSIMHLSINSVRKFNTYANVITEIVFTMNSGAACTVALWPEKAVFKWNSRACELMFMTLLLNVFTIWEPIRSLIFSLTT